MQTTLRNTFAINLAVAKLSNYKGYLIQELLHQQNELETDRNKQSRARRRKRIAFLENEYGEVVYMIKELK